MMKLFRLLDSDTDIFQVHFRNHKIWNDSKN